MVETLIIPLLLILALNKPDLVHLRIFKF